MKKNLLTPQDFYTFSKREDAVILDASMPKPGQSSDENLSIECIPGALNFNITRDFSLPKAEFPNTYPGDADLAKGLGQIGIDERTTVLIYDDKGLYSAPRVWYMLKRLGHNNVYILDGGLPRWKKEGFELTTQYSKPGKTKTFSPQIDPKFEFISMDEMLKHKSSGEYSVLDARSAERFSGKIEEPRPEVQSGHIPGSINLPFSKLLDQGQLKSISELEDAFSNAQSKLIFSCGSGITACVLALAADELGKEELMVFDGSWTEYGSSNHPIEKD